jgi:geranylgeranyl diphosphate synthase type II
MGTGFQLMDDLLDVYAEPDKFGKQVGGDILANKKTYLLIKAQENCQGADKEQLTAWLQKVDYNPQQKVAAVTELYNRCGVKTLAEAKMQEYFNEGFAELNKLPVAEEKLQLLLGLFKGLAKRES